MNFLLQRGRVVIIIFTAMSLASIVFIATATQNYLNFFPAVQGIQAEVSSITFRPSSSSQEDLSVSVRIINPNDYSGITIGQVTVKVFFFSSNDCLFDCGYFVGAKNVYAPLGPNARVSTNITVITSPSEASNITSFVRDHPHLVSANILLRVDLNTFLDPATGPTVVQNDRDLPLSISPPNAIL